MTTETFEHGLRAFLRLKPFKPFTVELVSGDRFSVDHPEAVAVLRGGVAVHSDRRGEITIFDRTSVSQILEATRNGGRRARPD
jgi:hypothetical protein